MAKNTKDKIIVKGIEVRYSRINQNDYMSLTDIAQFKNPNATKEEDSIVPTTDRVDMNKLFL